MDDGKAKKKGFAPGLFFLAFVALTAAILGMVGLSQALAAAPFGGPICVPRAHAPSTPEEFPLWMDTGASWFVPIRAEIETLSAQYEGEMAIFIHDLHWGQHLGYRAQEPRYLASGIKLLAMVGLYEERRAGRLRFDERLSYEDRHVRDGSPDLNKRNTGNTFPVTELLDYMIRNSDNASSDILIERMGLEQWRRNLDALHLTSLGPLVNLMDVRLWVYSQLDPRAKELSTREIRDVRWRDHHHPRLDLLKKHIGEPHGTYGEAELEKAYDAYYALGRNHLSMLDAAKILAAISRGTLVDEASSAEMYTALATTWNSGDRSWGAIPPGYAVAHKTGTQRRRMCDLAVLELPCGHRVIFTVAISEGHHEDADTMVRRLARRVWEEVGSGHQLHHGKYLKTIKKPPKPGPTLWRAAQRRIRARR
jgi:beta-lactamase class A